MIEWISVKELPEMCCCYRSAKVAVAGIDEHGDKNWGEGYYYYKLNRWSCVGWQSITHWSYINLPEIERKEE